MLKKYTCVIMIIIFSFTCISCNYYKYSYYDDKALEVPDVFQNEINSNQFNLLIWYFCSSRDWAVKSSSDGLFASYDELKYSNKSIVSRVYFDKFQISTIFDLPPNIIKNNRASIIKLYKMKYSDNDTYCSNVNIQLCNKMSIDIFEESDTEDRTYTEDTINSIKSVLSNIDNRDDIKTILLRDKSIIRNSPQLLNVYTTDLDGIYYLEGYFNPGEMGYVHINVIDKDTGKSVLDNFNSSNTKQIIGWSNDSSEQYYYTTELTIKNGSEKEEFTGEIDVMFSPINSDKETCIFTKTLNLHNWVR